MKTNTHSVIDTQSGQVVSSHTSRQRAANRAEKLNQEYGAVRYTAAPIPAVTPEANTATVTAAAAEIPAAGATKEDAPAAQPKPACLCGCGQTPKGKKASYCPGHDARHHAMLNPRVMPSCSCGCGAQTKGGRFLPGHDARLQSALRLASRLAAAEAIRLAAVEAFAL